MGDQAVVIAQPRLLQYGGVERDRDIEHSMSAGQRRSCGKIFMNVS